MALWQFLQQAYLNLQIRRWYIGMIAALDVKAKFATARCLHPPCISPPVVEAPSRPHTRPGDQFCRSPHRLALSPRSITARSGSHMAYVMDAAGRRDALTSR